MLFVTAKGFALVFSGAAQTLGLGGVGASLMLAFSLRCSRVRSLQAADCSCVIRSARVVCQLSVVASTALVLSASRASFVLFRSLRARLLRYSLHACRSFASGFAGAALAFSRERDVFLL